MRRWHGKERVGEVEEILTLISEDESDISPHQWWGGEDLPRSRHAYNGVLWMAGWLLHVACLLPRMESIYHTIPGRSEAQYPHR